MRPSDGVPAEKVSSAMGQVSGPDTPPLIPDTSSPFHWSCPILWPDTIKRRAVAFSESGLPAEGEAIMESLSQIEMRLDNSKGRWS